MMSKHCFYRVMREDLRHRIWMLALSILGNMMALPVAFLLVTQASAAPLYGPAVYSSDAMLMNYYRDLGCIEEIGVFFGGYALVTGAVIAIAGAFIVGYGGYRYLYHGNMVDTYHAAPVKRKTLFGAVWLNGFLIWFVPYFVMMLLTTVMGTVKLGGLRRAVERYSGAPEFMGTMDYAAYEKWTGGALVREALICVFATTIAFLLVYNLCVLAVMLCGNVLNTLVFTGIAGGGAIAIYGLGFAFFSVYFKTFVEGAAISYKTVMYGSPLASAVTQLIYTVQREDWVKPNLINLCIASAIGGAAFVLYLRRPSELAEQGTRWKPARIVGQIVVALAGTMGGWLIFGLITSGTETDTNVVWGIFGGLLLGILSFGIMDIIMNMDFKAFFAHKIFMAATVAAGLLLCLALRLDWIGYDAYLPKESEIAEISLWDSNIANNNTYRYSFSDPEHTLQKVHIRDAAAAYAYLANAVSYYRDGNEPAEFVTGDVTNITTEYVKVTLKSGRTYYRQYTLSNRDADFVYALASTREYLDVNFRISEEEMANWDWQERDDVRIDLSIRYNDFSDYLDSRNLKGFIRAFCTAYNEDLEQNYETVLKGNKKQFCIVRIDRRNMEVYEGMDRAMAVMREYGLGKYAEDPKNVKEIRLRAGAYWYDGKTYDGEELIRLARDFYGVAAQGTSENGAVPAPAYDEDSFSRGTEDDIALSSKPSAAPYTEEYDDNRQLAEIVLSVTDPREIEELLNLLSLQSYRDNSVLKSQLVYGTIVVTEEIGADGEPGTKLSDGGFYFRRGTLPEKYILRFGDVAPENRK